MSIDSVRTIPDRFAIVSEPRRKVLCIIDSLARGGGAERLLVDLLPLLRARGFEISVATLQRAASDHSKEFERVGIRVHQLDLPSVQAVPEVIRKLRRLVRDHGYSIFWGHLYYGNIYAWLARRTSQEGRFIATVHSSSYSLSPPTGLRQKLAAALEKRAMASADVVVAVSRAVQRDYETYFGISNVTLAYNGIDTRALARVLPVDRVAERRRFAIAADEFLVITPASLSAVKGHNVLIEAVELLRHTTNLRVRCIFCGDGPLKSMIAADIALRGLGDQIVLSPVIPHDELMPLVAAADAFVMPSHREGLSLAAAESMALKVPGIFSDIEGFREMTVGVDAALFFPPGGASELAAAIAEVRGNPEAAQARASRALDHVRANFDIHVCADRWAEILGEV